MRDIVFDSSFLMAVMEHPTTWYEDIVEKFGSFKPTVLDVVRKELTSISKGGGKRSKFAALALELTGSFTVARATSEEGRPDDEIISFAKKNKAAVATIDGDLMDRSRALRIPVVTLRRGRVHVWGT